MNVASNLTIYAPMWWLSTLASYLHSSPPNCGTIAFRRQIPLCLKRQDAIGLKMKEGMFLLENGLLHLDPTWINELLRAILDHRLQDPGEADFWEEQMEKFLHNGAMMEVDDYQLSNVHQTFCATGTLTVGYLYFLWRDVEGINQEVVFARLLETLRKHGVLFSKLGTSLAYAAGSNDVESSAWLFVPVRLQPYFEKEKLKKISGVSLHQVSRRQLRFCITQSYVPPGIMGMLMARLLDDDDIEFHFAWSRGLSFMMAGSEVILFLNAPKMDDGKAGNAKAEIEVNVVGPTFTNELKTKAGRMEAEIKSLMQDNFPGIRFYLAGGKAHLIEGKDVSIERIDTLEAHLDVRLDKIEGKLDEVAACSRESLMYVRILLQEDFPYPHLVVVREHTPGRGHTTPSSGKTAGRRRKKLALGKALFLPFRTRVRKGVKKEMRLQFLCPYDFSLVPCGPDGDGYPFEENRDWVKRLFPAVQVCSYSVRLRGKCCVQA